MITGFPPSPFAERPVRNLFNLIGAGLGFAAAMLVIIAGTDTSGLAQSPTGGSGIAVALILVGALGVLANERVGAALVVGGGVNLLAVGISTAIHYVSTKHGPSVPVSDILTIVAGIVALAAVALSFPGLKTQGNIIIGACAAAAGLVFAVAEIYVMHRLPAGRLGQYALPYIVVALVMIIAPLIGRIGTIAAAAAATPFLQQAASVLRHGGSSFNGLYRYGVPAALLAILLAAIVNGVLRHGLGAGAGADAAAPGAVPATQTMLWAGTMPAGTQVVAGGVMALDPWAQHGPNGSMAVLPTNVVQISQGMTVPYNPARWIIDPYKRFDQRWWDGVRWTADVIGTNGEIYKDPM
jgi:hypothetical protein